MNHESERVLLNQIIKTITMGSVLNVEKLLI